MQAVEKILDFAPRALQLSIAFFLSVVCAVSLAQAAVAAELPVSAEVSNLNYGDSCSEAFGAAVINFVYDSGEKAFLVGDVASDCGVNGYVNENVAGSTWRFACYDMAMEPCPPFQEWQYPADVCGDGYQTGAEACDDDNAVSGDGCSSACTIEQIVSSEPVQEPDVQSDDISDETAQKYVLAAFFVACFGYAYYYMTYR